MRRSFRRIVTLGSLAALVAPVAVDRDGFPLSTYPMYSRTRGAHVSFVSAVGIDDAGGFGTLSLGLIGASDDPLVVAGELRTDISNGRGDQRCEQIARRVAGRLPGRYLSIEVVTERHDTIAALERRPSVVSRMVHARCEVDDDR